jgi:hypothetical protein
MPRPLEGAGAVMKKGPRSTEKLKIKFTDHIAIDQRMIEEAYFIPVIRSKNNLSPKTRI